MLIIDTAGRLHNKKNLMDELGKMRRIIDREAPDANIQTLLVIDATTGQNAILQAETFAEVAKVDSVAVTKLDGNAKGGVAVAVAYTTNFPIVLAGLGEGRRTWSTLILTCLWTRCCRLPGPWANLIEPRCG